MPCLYNQITISTNLLSNNQDISVERMPVGFGGMVQACSSISGSIKNDRMPKTNITWIEARELANNIPCMTFCPGREGCSGEDVQGMFVSIPPPQKFSTSGPPVGQRCY